MTLVGGTIDYSGFATRRPRDRGGVRGSRRSSIACSREVEPACSTRRDLRVEHEHDSRSRASPRRRRIRSACSGMHFFSPVHKMPLLEVIVTPATDARGDASTAVAYGKKLGKTVIVVNDGPGFYTTRTLSAYMNEAGRCSTRASRSKRSTGRWSISAFPVGRSRCSTKSASTSGEIGAVMLERVRRSAWRRAASLAKVIAAGRTGRRAGRASTSTRTAKKAGRRRDRVSADARAMRQRMLIRRREIERALRARDGERGGALPGGGDPREPARRRRRRGVRHRLPAVPRRPVPLCGHARHPDRDSSARGARRPLLTALSSRRGFSGKWRSSGSRFYPDREKPR